MKGYSQLTYWTIFGSTAFFTAVLAFGLLKTWGLA
jgi:hypothetical protein